MDILEQQCFLGGLGFYRLKRRDGSLAVDGIPGPATRTAVYNFQLSHRVRPDGSLLVTDGLWGPKTEAALRQVIGSGEEVQQELRKAEEGIPSWWSKYPDVHREDWRCRCGGRFCNGFPAEPEEETVAMLQKFADHFGGPVLWNSGLRCPRYNASIPGASPNSKHRLGMAYDFHMAGVSPRSLYEYGDRLMPDRGGIGLYSWGIHLDNRPVKARWRG